MLRYVFDTASQLRGHLHAVAADSWLFYPDPAIPQKGGEVVPLEVELRKPRQQVMLRGTIHSRVGGAAPGIWVRFSDLRLARKLETNAEEISRRAEPRVTSDLMIEIREPNAQGRIARLLDVSVGGACLGAAAGLRSGMAVDLHLISRIADIPQAFGRAIVVRALGSVAGIRFSPEMAARARKLVEVSRQAWKAARTVDHARACCGPRGVLDPPVPRIRADRRLL